MSKSNSSGEIKKAKSNKSSDIYSVNSDHFLTGEEGSSSSFGPHGGSENSGHEPDSEETWVQWYCRQRGNEMLCEIDMAFLYDDTNLNGLKPQERKDYDLSEFDPKEEE